MPFQYCTTWSSSVHSRTTLRVRVNMHVSRRAGSSPRLLAATGEAHLNHGVLPACTHAHHRDSPAREMLRTPGNAQAAVSHQRQRRSRVRGERQSTRARGAASTISVPATQADPAVAGWRPPRCRRKPARPRLSPPHNAAPAYRACFAMRQYSYRSAASSRSRTRTAAMPCG